MKLHPPQKSMFLALNYLTVLEQLVDVIVDDDSEEIGDRVSTIIDLTKEPPEIARRGLGWEQAVTWAS